MLKYILPNWCNLEPSFYLIRAIFRGYGSYETKKICFWNLLTFKDNVKKLAVINVYCPQDRGGERLEYQLKFYKLLEMRAVNLIKAGVSVIILGDINCSHKEIDHCEPYPGR